jgi:hypothetical protein
MMSLDDFRKALGQRGKSMTNEDLDTLRIAAYRFADAVFDRWLRKRNAPHESDSRESAG